MLVVMPSDHAIADEAGFVAAVRLAAEVAAAQSKLVLFGIKPDVSTYRLRLHPPGAPRSMASTVQAFRGRCASPKSPMQRRRARYLDEGGLLLEQRHFRSRCPHVSARARAPGSPAVLEARAQRPALARRATLAFSGWMQRPLPSRRTFRSIMRSWRRPSAAVMLPIDVGWSDVGSWASLWEIGRARRAEQLRSRRRRARGQQRTLRSQRALPGCDHRRQGSHHRRYARTRCWWPTGARPGRFQGGCQAAAIESQGARAAPAQLPAVGIFRDAVHRSALPGQAAARETRRQALDADASSPLRALGRRAGHGQGDGRRHRDARGRERERLHPRHSMASPGEPGQGAARAHRGADRHVSGRGRHHPQR